jgi:hypothetical protein
MSEEKIEPMTLSELKSTIVNLESSMHVPLRGIHHLTSAIDELKETVRHIEKAKRISTDPDHVREIGWDR